MKDCQTIAKSISPIDTGHLRNNSIKAYLLNDGFVVEQRFNVAWYGTLLDQRDYTRKDNGKTTRGWWTEGVYNSILAYTRSNLNEQLDQITSSRDIVAKTAKMKPSLVNASANRGR